jgi:hypothetical protein
MQAYALHIPFVLLFLAVVVAFIVAHTVRRGD